MEIDIRHLENLSKLEIEESKKQQFKNDFENILSFVDEITKLEIPDEKRDGVRISNLREDEVKQNKDFDALKNAPKEKDGCFQVPLVVE